MSGRELVVLGTASQAPTRHRNHNGYLLRWDGESTLFDPGEGTQRQLLLAGVSSWSIRRICVTHFHGDHCLGLPGILQRMSLDRVPHPVRVLYPAAGQQYYERLRHASVFDDRLDVRPVPVDTDGPVDEGGPAGAADRGVTDTTGATSVVAHQLFHRTETYGWRIVEPDGRHLLVDRLERAGVRGPAVGRLQRDGAVEVDGRPVALEEVSEPRPGQVVAFIMDTGLCDAAVTLAAGADLVVCESTFATADRELALRYRHLTAADAARVARDGGARRLVLTHFSQRYPDVRVLYDEAAAIFDDVVLAEDLLRVEVPARRRSGAIHR